MVIVNDSSKPEWLKSVWQRVAELANPDPDFIVVQTSGSTGKPKKIKIQKSTLVQSAQNTAKYLQLGENCSALLCLPTNYIGGIMMLVRAFALNWNLTIVKPSSNPLQRLEKQFGFDFAAMTPMQVYSTLFEGGIQERENLNRINTIIIGGGEVGGELLKEIQKVKSRCYSTYGMTETASHIAMKKLNGNDSVDFFQALDGITFSKDKRSCLEILCDFLNQKPIITNDLIELKNSKQFKWLGRFDNVINSGGVKIIPETVEKKLFPIVEGDFFVSGFDDEKYGNRPVIIVSKKPCSISLFKSELQKNLKGVHRPKQLFIVPEFVFTPNGKVDRSATRKLALKVEEAYEL